MTAKRRVKGNGPGASGAEGHGSVEERHAIRLTWAQFTWGIAVLVTLVFGFGNISWRLAAIEGRLNDQYTRSQIDAMRALDTADDKLRDARIERLESK